jgi:LacI family transcriptional regulator
VRKAIETLGYQPNQIGRALKRGKSRVVAMLTANLNNPVMATIASSTETALRAAGYVMILCDTHDRADLQDEYLRAMHSQAVQGYILVTNVDSPVLADFVARREPMVFACRRNPYEPGAFVGIDNVKAGSDAADYLWTQGGKELAIVYPTEGSAVTNDRLTGFCARLVELGIPEEMILKAEASGRSHMNVGYEAARALSPWPRSIMCVSDQIAYGVYRFAREQGIRIPDDCSVVSIDGGELNEWLAPWLRSVHVPYQDFGRHIVDLLETIWSGRLPTETILPYRL